MRGKIGVVLIVGTVLLLTGFGGGQEKQASDIIGDWYSYGTYKIDKDGEPDDIVFHFTEEGTFHNRFYQDLDNEKGLITETKGTYTFTGSTIKWTRTHRLNGSEWVSSDASGEYGLDLEGDQIRLTTDTVDWTLTRK